MDVEHGVTERQMTDLDKAILARFEVEINVAHSAQRIGGAETRQSRDPTTSGNRGIDPVQNVPGPPGTADGHQQIACPMMQFDLLREYVFIPEIVAEAGQRR